MTKGATTMRDVESVPQPLGPRIRVARENAGFSLEEAARRLGVRAETFSAWERDEQVPRANRLPTLAGLLNVTLSWLLEGRESEFMESQGQPTLESLRVHVDAVRVRLADAVEMLDDLSRRLESAERAD